MNTLRYTWPRLFDVGVLRAKREKVDRDYARLEERALGRLEAIRRANDRADDRITPLRLRSHYGR